MHSGAPGGLWELFRQCGCRERFFSTSPTEPEWIFKARAGGGREARIELRDSIPRNYQLNEHLFSLSFSQKRLCRFIEGLGTLSIIFVVLVAVRVLLMGSKAPEFTPADNPSTDFPSWLTRTFTFFCLPVFNFCPCRASSGPLVATPRMQQLNDPCTLVTLTL